MLWHRHLHPSLLVSSILLGVTYGSPLQEWKPSGPTPRPLVFWHGLGDSYASPAMLECMQTVRDMHPGIFIHSIYLHDSLEDDRRAGFVRPISLSVQPGGLILCSSGM